MTAEAIADLAVDRLRPRPNNECFVTAPPLRYCSDVDMWSRRPSQTDPFATRVDLYPCDNPPRKGKVLIRESPNGESQLPDGQDMPAVFGNLKLNWQACRARRGTVCRSGCFKSAGSAGVVRNLPIASNPAMASSSRRNPLPDRLIGSTKPEVDRLMSGWRSRKSSTSTSRCTVWMYQSEDVKLGVFFRFWRAVGVGVVDLPGAGHTGISDARRDELVRLITGGMTVERDEKIEEGVRREFYVGDTDSDA